MRDAEPERRTPRVERAPAGPTGACAPAGPEPAARRRRAQLTALPDSALDLGDDAGLLVEELRVRLGPAAEVLVDGQQLRRGRERVARVVGALDVDLDAVVERAEALLGVVGLALLARSGSRGTSLALRAGVRGDRARVLDQQRLVRDDVVEVRAALPGEDRLVLVGEQHVAGAAR